MIDTHVHLASDDLDAYPHSESAPFRTDPYVNTAEQLLAAMDAAGVERATVVQPFGLYWTDNSYHADSAARFPDRLVGICGVPSTVEGADLLRYWIGERGMRGARVITLGQGITLDDPGLGAVCRTAAELGAPTCLLTSRKHLDDLPDLARRFPELRIVLDHLGLSGGLDDVDAAIARLTPITAVDNIFLKISTSMLGTGPDGRRLLEFVIAHAGVERILWGSNYPVTDEGGYPATVDVTHRALAFLSPAERDRIVAGTARDLWPDLAR